jgi:5-methylcytosine-specific restriction protein A
VFNAGPTDNDFVELPSFEGLFEGAKKTIVLNQYERNRDARQKCIDAHVYKCKVCGMDFEKMYGELGRGFIHIHHVVPISTIGKEYLLDPVKDLVPVCPNCHAMLHRGINGRVLTVEELRNVVGKQK